MKKRLLSLFLCVMMLLTLVPVTALAQDIGGADDQAAAQEAVQESVEDTAEDAVPAEPVKPDEAEGPVVPTREEAALDEPAEEDIATQDETGDDQATIVSIACAEETDADGYVHVMEGTDVYMEQEKGEWMSNVDVGAVKRLEFTLEYIPAGSTEQQPVTGNAWTIWGATGMEVSYTGDHTYNEDSGMYTPWKSGDTYDVTITLGGKSTPLKLKVDDNLVTSVVADNSEAIELVKGENGDYRTETNSEGTEEQVWYYSLYGSANATFTVTLQDGTTFSGTREEINRQIDKSAQLSSYGIWFDYSAGDTSVWKPGQEYKVWYGMNGVGVERTVTISDAPSFASITPNFTDPIELLEGVDGYHTGDGTFRYNWTFADSNPTFTVTLTEDGVRRYGTEPCIGTYEELRDRFPGVYMEAAGEKTEDEWPVRDEPYSFDVKLGTVSCPVEVKVVKNLAKTIKVVGDPIEVQYGTDAHFWIDGDGKEHWEYYYILQAHELQYSLTINDEPVLYTYDEVCTMFNAEPGMYGISQQMADGRWKVGSERNVQMYFCGVVFDVPVKVVEPEHTVEELTYIGGSMTLASGVHDQGSELFGPDDIYNDFKVLVTYDGGQRKLMSEYQMYKFFGAWPDVTSNQTDDPWQVGQEDCKFYVQLCEQLLTIPVTVIENPVADLAPVDTITLSDNDRYETEAGYYRYDVTRLSGKFKLTLTEAGAAIYNGGETECTGTLDEICKLLDCSLDGSRVVSDQGPSNVWLSSDEKSHKVTIKLGGEFEVPVTLLGVSYYFESLELADENYVVKLKEGADAASCLNGEFLYDATNDDELKLKLTLTEAGKEYFDQTEKEFTRTISELFWMFQYGVKQIEDNVRWNEDGVTGTATLGIGNGMFGDPDANGPTCTVNVKLEKSEVASIKCVNAPVTLYEGVDDDGEFLGRQYYQGYTMTRVLSSERAQFEVTLTDGETFTGGSDVICSRLGFRPMADSAALYAQKEQPWSPDDGIEHAFTVYLGTASCTVPVTFGTATEIEINEENFPDEAFRNYLLYSHSYDGATVKMETVTSIDCSGWGITSLKGIELFQELTILNCNENLLEELDVSQNSKLRELSCYNNLMINLDVSKNVGLVRLVCYNNKLQELDVRNNTKLTHLDCGNNPLGKLDVSKNAELEVLDCYNDQLTTLDISSNTKLTELYCSGNALETLDVSKNTALKWLSCYNNKLKTLDVTKNTKLVYLDCDDNPLGTLDVSTNSALESLYCNSCQLTALDVSKNVALKELVCHFNSLTTLDISNNTALLEVGCSGNNLTSVNASKCENLEVLYCANNQSTDKLTVYVAKLEGLNLSTTGAQGDVQIIVNGTLPAEKPIAGTLNADGMRLTLSQNGEVKYVTMVVGDQYRFDAVANGTYTLTAEDYSYYDYIPRSVEVTVTDGAITGMENFKIAVRGDMNLDGTVDVYDLQLLYECVSQITEVKDDYVMAVADVNGRDGVDIIDVQLLYTILTGSGGIDSAKTG